MTQTLRRWIFFWNVPPRPAEAEVSLAALLARRDTVRSTQTAPAIDPKPDLFRPQKEAVVPLPGEEEQAIPQPQPTVAVSEPPKPDDQPAPTTTSRLLDAKRRAQQRKK